MRGKLIAAGAGGDPTISPHQLQGSSPVATPRSSGCPVGLCYFLLLRLGSNHSSNEMDPHHSVGGGGGHNSSHHRRSFPTAVPSVESMVLESTTGGGSSASPSPVRGASAPRLFGDQQVGQRGSFSQHQRTTQAAGDDDGTAGSSSPSAVYVIAIDNITGQLQFSGTPNVDVFADEATAMMALPNKASLVPEGVRVSVVCTFDAWCGCYATEEQLHFLFVVESSAVTTATAHPHASGTPLPSQHGDNSCSLPIHRADRVVWKSIRLQCPQHVLTGVMPTPSLSSAAPQSHPDDGRRSATASMSNMSCDVERPVDIPVAGLGNVFVSSDQDPGGDARKALYFSTEFDLTDQATTHTFALQQGHRRHHRTRRSSAEGVQLCTNENEGQPAIASTLKRQTPWSDPSIFVAARHLLEPDLHLVHTEHLWNIELIRFCEMYGGVGDCCTRLMYGIVQRATSKPPACSDVSENAEPCGCELLLVSRVSRAAYRLTLEGPPNKQSSAALGGGLPNDGTNGSDGPMDDTVRQAGMTQGGSSGAVEIHAPMECELQLLVTTAAPRDHQPSPHTAIADDGARAGVAFGCFRGKSTISGSKEILGYGALHRARERRHRCKIEDVHVPLRTTAATGVGAPQPQRGGATTAPSSPQGALSPISHQTPAGLVETFQWDLSMKRLLDEVDTAATSVVDATPCADKENKGQRTAILRRVSMVEERQLATSLVTVFVWAVDALRTGAVLPIADAVAREVHPVHSPTVRGGGDSILHILWLLLFQEAAAQYAAPAPCTWESFQEAMKIVRYCSSGHLQHPHHAPHQGSGGVGWHATLPTFAPGAWDVNASLLYAASKVRLSEQLQAPSLDHSYATFLQTLVDYPRSQERDTTLACAPRVLLLSDPNGGTAIIKASVLAQTDASLHGRAEANKIPLENGDDGQRGKSNANTAMFTESSNGVPLPTLAALRSVLMPKSPGVRIPEGHDGIAFTVALPTLSRLTHIGIMVPSTLQEVVFASPLCMTVTCGEYMSPALEKVVLQEVLLPLCLGNAPTASASMVLFPVGPSPSRRGGTRSTTCMWSSFPQSEAPSTIGRYVTITVRASGKTSILLGNVLLFGTPVSIAGGPPNSGSHHLRNVTVLPKNASGVMSAGTAGTVLASAAPPLHQITAAAATARWNPDTEARRFLLESFVSIRPSLEVGWQRSRKNSSFALVDAASIFKTFALQTGERYRVTETQRSVLLHGRSVEVTAALTRAASGERSLSEGTSPPLGRSPTQHIDIPDFSNISHSDGPMVSEVRDRSPAVYRTTPTISPRGGNVLSSRGSIANLAAANEVETLSLEDQFLLQLRRVVQPERGGSITLLEAAVFESTRLKLPISRAVRDRCSFHANVSVWLLDFANHVYPRSVCFDYGHGKKNRGSQCQRCHSHLSFLSKKRACYSCGDVLCVKCTVPFLVSLLEFGLQEASATVCSRCLNRATAVEAALSELAKQLTATASTIGVHHTFRANALTRRGWDAPTTGVSATSSPPRLYPQTQEIVLVPPTNSQMRRRCDLFPAPQRQGSGSVDLHYNLCVPNAVAVVVNPRLNRPCAGRLRTEYVECILGHVEVPGRGWRCLSADEGGNPRVVTTRSVVLLLPGYAEVEALKMECARRGCGLGLGTTPVDAPMDLSEQQTQQRAPTTVRPPKIPSSVTVSVVVADSSSLFETPIIEGNTNEMACSDARWNTWTLVASRSTYANGGSGGSLPPPPRCRMACIRFTGTTQDLLDLEVLHISLWGRYVVSSGKDASLSRLHFPPIGQGSVGHCHLRYSLRHATGCLLDTPVHRHVSIMGQTVSAMGGGSMAMSATTASHFHATSVCAQLPHKARPLQTKGIHQVVQCTSSYIVEYDFGNPVTVCGVVIENHHPLLCSASRIATVLRFVGIGVDGRRGNLAYLPLPVALIASAASNDDAPSFAASEPLSMAFGFPSSSHNLRGIQVEAVAWNAVPSQSNGAREAAGGGGGGSGCPYMGKLTFWSSPDAHTRRIVASGTYFSIFRDARDAALSPR